MPQNPLPDDTVVVSDIKLIGVHQTARKYHVGQKRISDIASQYGVSKKHKPRVPCPITKHQLMSLLEDLSEKKIAQKFQVSQKCVRAWMSHHSIQSPRAKSRTRDLTYGCKVCGKITKTRSEKTAKKRKFCSNHCQQKLKHEATVKMILNGSKSAVSTMCGLKGSLRKYLIDKSNNQCSKCGWSEKNTTSGKVPLEINHIDGDWRNNDLSNLEVLCPNCHALTPNYGALNKGKGRHTYLVNNGLR